MFAMTITVNKIVNISGGVECVFAALFSFCLLVSIDLITCLRFISTQKTFLVVLFFIVDASSLSD